MQHAPLPVLRVPYCSVRPHAYREGMIEEPSSWEITDLPVLRWVHEKPWGMEWRFDRSDEPSEEVPDLPGTELDAAVRRLEEHGLVTGRRKEFLGFFVWNQLRVTANGLRVLEEWPPDPRVGLDRALVQVLRGLADESDEPESSRFRRAAGSVARFGGDVLADVAKSELRRAGGEIGG